MNSEKSTSSKRTGIIVGGLAAVTVAAAAFAGAGGGLPFVQTQESHLSLTPVSTAPIFQPPPGAPLSFADIFERVSPAVVSIHVKSKVPVQQGMQFNIPGFPFDPEDFQAPQGRGGRGQGGAAPQPRTREAMSSGSGFFISPDGYIVTNNHVVENATEINIVMTDKRELKATVVGTDEATDLAVLKVDGRNFPFVNFENSAKPRVGDWVITIGNPFDLGGTATAGIVSASSRNIPDDESSKFVDFLQIDAAINRGNSGGPTFDVYGRVIGVNSAIFSPSPSGGSVGIGFAIPAEVADVVTKELISGGKITRGFLGASVTDFTKDMAEGQGDDYQGHGAYVQEVTDNGPAEAAGLKRGDVVLSVNGKEVPDATGLTRMVAATRSGDALRLEVLREHKVRQINVKSGIRPSERELASNDNDRSGAGSNNDRTRRREEPEAAKPTILGLSLAPLDEQTRRRYNVENGVEGVLVTQVDPESPVADRLKRGDVVMMARGAPVTTPQQLATAVEAQRRTNRDQLLVMVMRGGESGTMLLDLVKKPEQD